jgi:soluble lytic murein transglycosylase
MRHSLRLLYATFILVFVSLTSVAQTPDERHRQIISAVQAGDLKKALADLTALRQSDTAAYNANNYDYLHARLSDLDRDSAQANSAYQSVVNRNSILSQYALWHLAQSSRSIGDLVLERERLRRLIAIAPNSLLCEAAILRLSESFFESADYESVIAESQQLSRVKKVATAREAAVLLGQSYQRLGKTAEAQTVFQKLIMQMPDASRPDDFALEAVRALDLMRGAAETKSARPELSEADHLLYASIYQFNRDFKGARVHYLAIIQQSPQSPTVPNALYQTGRGFYLEGKYDEALKYFQRVLNEFPGNTVVRDALVSLAASYNRLGRPDDAIKSYTDLSKQSPDPQNPERAYLNIIDILHENGRYAQALDWVQRTRKQFAGQIGDALALFARMRIHLAQSDWQSTVSDADELLKLSDLGGTRVPGGTTSAEVTFLKAVALEQLGRIDEAVSLYLSLPDGRSEYYGRRATQRLLALSGDGRSRGKIEARFIALRDDAKNAVAAGQLDRARLSAELALRLTQNQPAVDELHALLSKTYSSLPAYKLPSFNLTLLGRQQLLSPVAEGDPKEPPHQKIADELFFLGLYDEAIPEFVVARMATPVANASQKSADAPKQTVTPSGLTDIDYSIALYSLRGGLANRAVRFAEQVWKAVPADYVLDLAPAEMVELLYPAPYRDSLLKHAPTRNVDPRFVLSIARQESRFQPDAKSVAAARGMMQFIAATADEIASQLGRQASNHDELYNPDTAVMFGSQYLANLFKQFSDPQAVASSYNGGPDNTARWIARSRSKEPDRYVPEIGFSQTKDYVYKVMTNYWTYQQFYDSQLQRKFPAK